MPAPVANEVGLTLTLPNGITLSGLHPGNIDLLGAIMRAVVMRPRYLRPALTMPQIYLYRAPIDFRKQAPRGAGRAATGAQPFTGALYAFTNRRRNKIKCLMWEDNGFVLYYKALAEEKFKWPSSADELLSLSSEQINWLLDGYDISLMQGHKTLHYETL